MADGDRKTYPRLPAKNWWTLRDRFKQTMPSRVDADYLQSVLGLTSTASAGNLIGPLRNMGLIDEKGAPTDRALDWRHDESYAEVCRSIVAEIYPDALVSAFPHPSHESSGVTNWFARNTGAGQGAASGMAALYSLLADGDPTIRPSAVASANGKAMGAPKAAKSPPKSPSAGTQKTAPTRQDGDAVQRATDRPAPSINVNVQVHISADASPQQIDQIFKSMAEHLYGPIG